jgi:hypothetical protein
MDGIVLISLVGLGIDANTFTNDPNISLRSGGCRKNGGAHKEKIER